ncbi:MAG: ion transporter [Bacteroidota bacterium]|jgi:hypothetical protein|nr:ion transporter [Bacteroidota bacterium]
MRWGRTSRRLFTEQRHVVSHRVPAEKKRFDTALLLLALVSVIVFLVELRSPDPLGLLFGFSLLVDFVFLADYLLRAYYSGLDSAGRWTFRRSAENYLFRWYGIVDALATLPPILTHVFHVFALFTEFTRISRLLRLARFTRFLRVFRAARVFKETRKVTRLMRAHHGNISRELHFTLGIVLVVIVAGGLGLHYLSDTSDALSRNPLEAIYWSIMSVMGQSDPDELISWSTRGLGILIIFAGIAFFGIVSGSITTFIMDAMNKRSNGTDEFIGRDHIVVCGFNSKLEELLGYLRRLPRGRDIVLLFDTGNEHAAQEFVGSYEDEHTGRAVHTQWVRGNPRTADGMIRANVAEAHEIIVLADEAHGGLSEEDLDARTLMTLEMLAHQKDLHLRRSGATSARGNGGSGIGGNGNGAARLWEDVRDELSFPSVRDTGITAPKHYDLVDLPTLSAGHPLFTALRTHQIEHGGPVLLLLNPWARKTLCLRILARVLAATDGLPPLQAICMHSSNLRSSGSDTPVLVLGS